MSLSLSHYHPEASQMLRDFWDHNYSFSEWRPRFDFTESDDNYTVEVEVPGLKKDDISITYEDQTLTVSGERKKSQEEEGKVRQHAELYYGKFSRSVRLPAKVEDDQIKAEYRDGILKVILPKDAGAKPKSIPIGQ